MTEVGDFVRLPAAEGGHVGEVVWVAPKGPRRSPVLVIRTVFGVVVTDTRVERLAATAA